MVMSARRGWRLVLAYLLVQLNGAPAAAPPRRGHVDHYGDPLPPGAVARIGTVRLRHSAPVLTAAFSLDGKTLASADQDDTICLWDVATGKELGRIEARGEERVTRLLPLPGGKHLLTVRDKPIPSRDDPQDPDLREWVPHFELWEVARGMILPSSRALPRGGSMALSLDGKRLALGGTDGTVTVYRLPLGDKAHQVFPGKSAVTCLAFAPDGKALAAGDPFGAVRVYDTSSGKALRWLADASKAPAVLDLAFTADGASGLVVHSSGEVVSWGLRGGRRVVVPRKGRADRSLTALLPDGRSIAVEGPDAIRLLDAAMGKEWVRLPGPRFGLRCLAFGPGGKLLAVASPFHTLTVWDVARGKPLHAFAHEPGGVPHVRPLPGGKTLAVQHGFERPWRPAAPNLGEPTDMLVRFWRLEGGMRPVPPAMGPSATLVGCLSPDGSTVAGYEHWNGWVRLIDTRSGKVARMLGKKEKESLTDPRAWSPDGRALVVARTPVGRGFNIPTYSAHLWCALTGKPLRELALVGPDELWHDRMGAAAFSPDGKVIALVSEKQLFHSGARVTLFDAATGKKIPAPILARLPATTTAWSPDSGLLTLAGDGRGHDERMERPQRDRGLYLFDVVARDVALRVECPAAPDCCAISPDGSLLAWGDAQGRVGVADLFTGRLLCLFRGHRGRVASVAFTENGRALVSGSADTTAMVWAVPPPPRGPALSPRELARLWDDLGGADAQKAHRACGPLRAAPAQAVPFLAGRLRPVAAADLARVRKLLTDLGSDSFTVREKATAELARLELTAAPLLREALAGRPSLEVENRMRRLLEAAEDTARSPARQREVRAVRVLETIASPEAVRAVEAAASGAPGALLTQQARAALRRLEKRRAAGGVKGP
jgi:WD40 repeat protein